MRLPTLARCHSGAGSNPSAGQSTRIARTVTTAAIFALLLATPLARANTNSNLDIARQLNNAFAEVVERVSPSVVVITVTERIARPFPADGPDRPAVPIPRDSFHRHLHPAPGDPPLPDLTQGKGSGVIIGTNGFILTNRHVVEDATVMEVRLKDGRRFKATIQGVDSGSDVAVIKISAENLPVATLADSSRTRVGEFAIAIGAPFSLDYSVTFGHVSAKGRANIIPALFGGGAMDQDFIQTDANINPGNSGGPLVNIEGEVIGINTLIRGMQTGIGFAIPSNLCREIAGQLIRHGRVTRAWLGLSIRAAHDDPAFNAGTDVDGVIVQGIIPDGPASRTTLRANDIITAIGGRPVRTPQQLRNEVRGSAIGQPLAVEVHRDGERTTLQIIPTEYVETNPSRIETPQR